MLTYPGAQKLFLPLTLFVSFSTTEDLLFYDEFSETARNNSNIKIIYTITRPEESQGVWKGEVGRISEALIKKYVKDILKQTYYIAGPPKMVSAMEAIVKNMGIPEEKIFKENFVGY